MAFKLKNKNQLLGLHETSNSLDNVIKEVDMPEKNMWGFIDESKTIHINKNLSDKDKDLVIAHETVHKRQMEDGRLKFDSITYSWKDKPGMAERRYPTMSINAKDKSLPWENEAYASMYKIKREIKRKRYGKE